MTRSSAPARHPIDRLRNLAIIAHIDHGKSTLADRVLQLTGAVDPREMTLARQLIDTLAADWKPEQYRDTYTDVLRQAIQQKFEGKEITAPVAKPRAEVVDLVPALF